ncbi:MAG: glycosyltransferase [Bdellovibrionales bacterium]|nr:glycosyltransferase [Bdellovibrionales bacterium]
MESLRAIARSVRHTYIVDNGSAPNNPILLEAEGLPNVTLLRLNFNLGIASALNRGVKLGLDSGADWILTLDQDTLLTGDAINKMLEAYNIHPNKNKIGILAPSHFDKDTGYQSRYLRGLKGPYTIRQIVMSSGSLIPRATFKIVPYFDDDLFIDLVDHDFCLKVREAGLEIIIVRHAQMAHSLGNIKRHAIGPFSFFSYNYPLERQYYRARNRVILYRRHLVLGSGRIRVCRERLVESHFGRRQ